LAIRKAAFGELHFEVANTMTIIAGIHLLHERNEEAAEFLWEQATSILERLYRESGSDTKVAMGLKGNLENLAGRAYDRGDFEKAESLFRRIIAISAQLGGCAQPCNVPTFARVLVRLGKHEEAEHVLNAAKKQPSQFAGLTGLAFRDAFIDLYKATGREDEAQALEAGRFWDQTARGGGRLVPSTTFAPPGPFCPARAVRLTLGSNQPLQCGLNQMAGCALG
jgi:hypothetical protein